MGFRFAKGKKFQFPSLIRDVFNDKDLSYNER